MANLLSVTVIDDIVQKIKTGILTENERLPSERLMAETFGVSRTVIREAMKILQEKGFVKMSAGRGNFITMPNEADLIDKFETAFDYSSISQEDIIEAREIIEIAIAKRIISRVQDQDIQILKEIYEEMNARFGNSEHYAKLDARFHLQLAGCTRNNGLKMITAALNNVTDRSIIADDIEVRQKSHKEHLVIIHAIENRDSKLLEEAIMEHLNCFREHLREYGS